MKRIAWIFGALWLAGCAGLGQGESGEPPAETWVHAQQALAVQDFDRAAALFTRLVEEHPRSREGREALFYLGSMRLDPRNPAWDPEPAEQYLRQYISVDTVIGVAVVHRRPEAETLLALATQLNMPVEMRVPALQAETRVVVEESPDRVVAPARESRALAAEVAQLRRQLAEREATIQEQRNELERIRRTLTGRDGGR